MLSEPEIGAAGIFEIIPDPPAVEFSRCRCEFKMFIPFFKDVMLVMMASSPVRLCFLLDVQSEIPGIKFGCVVEMVCFRPPRVKQRA